MNIQKNTLGGQNRTAANNAFPQLGADRCNSRRSNMAAVVWGMTLSNKHFVNFITTFLISITAWQTFSKTPN